jgi:hypothetical protein
MPDIMELREDVASAEFLYDQRKRKREEIAARPWSIENHALYIAACALEQVAGDMVANRRGELIRASF